MLDAVLFRLCWGELVALCTGGDQGDCWMKYVNIFAGGVDG